MTVRGLPVLGAGGEAAREGDVPTEGRSAGVIVGGPPERQGEELVAERDAPEGGPPVGLVEELSSRG